MLLDVLFTDYGKRKILFWAADSNGLKWKFWKIQFLDDDTEKRLCLILDRYKHYGI